jgi:uncharacterized protein
MIYDQIMTDLKTAMKDHDQAKVDVLRFAVSGLNNVKKEKQMADPAATLTDEETTSILQKEIKKRKESVELFKQGNRADLVEKEEADLAIISAYVPQELSRAEIEKIVDEVIAAGAKDFGSAMREAAKMTKGRADGKLVGEIVKAKLG